MKGFAGVCLISVWDSITPFVFMFDFNNEAAFPVVSYILSGVSAWTD
jgi:hypothetical protein